MAKSIAKYTKEEIEAGNMLISKSVVKFIDTAVSLEVSKEEMQDELNNVYEHLTSHKEEYGSYEYFEKIKEEYELACSELSRKYPKRSEQSSQKDASKIRYKTPEKSLMALDKLNDMFWQQQQIIPGENYIVNTAKKGSPEEIKVIFSIEKTEENSVVLSKLSPFDRRVYQAVSTFRYYYPKIKYITSYNIYSFMHGGGTPNSDDTKKIEKSLLSFTSTPFTYDCSAEAEAGYHYDFKKIKKSSYKVSETLLIGRVVSKYKKENGQTLECVLDMSIASDDYMPILTNYAIKHKQYTMIPVNILQTAGVNGSDKNYKLTDYMLSRVQHARRSRNSDNVKILYSTIYKNIGDTERKQKSRTRERIEKILKDWRAKEFIDSFKINKSSGKGGTETGVTIYF